MLRKIVEFSLQTNKNVKSKDKSCYYRDANMTSTPKSRKLRVKSAFGDSLPVKSNDNLLKLRQRSETNEYLKNMATVPTNENAFNDETRVSTAKNSPRKYNLTYTIDEASRGRNRSPILI